MDPLWQWFCGHLTAPYFWEPPYSRGYGAILLLTEMADLILCHCEMRVSKRRVIKWLHNRYHRGSPSMKEAEMAVEAQAPERGRVKWPQNCCRIQVPGGGEE